MNGVCLRSLLVEKTITILPCSLHVSESSQQHDCGFCAINIVLEEESQFSIICFEVLTSFFVARSLTEYLEYLFKIRTKRVCPSKLARATKRVIYI